MTGEVAVHFAGDTGAIVEGTREQIRQLLETVLTQLGTPANP